MRHQKVIVAIIICFASVFAVWIFKEQTERMAQKNLNSNTITTRSTEPSDGVDTDGDGLEDWLEILLGTDPDNPDTDGDGTPDGEEIAQGRDPRIKGPNDENPNIMSGVIASSQTVIYEEGDQPLTDQVSKELISRYLLLKQSGGYIDSDQAAQIADLSIPSKPIESKNYISSDLNITRNTDKATANKYKNDFETSLEKNLAGHLAMELVIVEDAMNIEDARELLRLDPIITGYKNLINDMLKMQVPLDAVSIHLEIINSFSQSLANIETMKTLFGDPMKTLIAIMTQADIYEKIGNSTQKLDSYFKSKN